MLAHTISVVAVQCSVALDALDAAPPETEEARDAMLLVRGAARQAMPELRAALDLLRGRATSADGRPQPGLRDLDELAERLRDSGLGVDLRVPPEAFALTPLVQWTAYRIAQEALTNTLRHARAGHAHVVLTRDGDVLVLRITDNGRGPGPGALPSVGGLGLVGIRERAEALGGQVTAGPQPNGSWQVRAELPWESL